MLSFAALVVLPSMGSISWDAPPQSTTTTRGEHTSATQATVPCHSNNRRTIGDAAEGCDWTKLKITCTALSVTKDVGKQQKGNARPHDKIEFKIFQWCQSECNSGALTQLFTALDVDGEMAGHLDFPHAVVI